MFKVWRLTFIVSVLLVFVGSSVCFGHTPPPEPPPGQPRIQPIPGGQDNPWNIRRDEVLNRVEAVDTAIQDLGVYKEALKLINGKWDAHQADIATGVEVTLSGAFATTASALASALAPSTPYTALAGGLLTLRKAVDLGLSISASDQYDDAIEAADAAVESAMADVAKAIVRYDTYYDNTYFPFVFGHAPARVAAGELRVYESKDAMRTAVHSQNLTTEWLHADIESISGIDDNDKHTVLKWYSKTGSYSDVEDKYECLGTCEVMFRSPYRAFIAHRRKCGPDTTKDVNEIYQAAIKAGGNALAGFKAIELALKDRTWDQGCGRVWYSCDSNAADKEVLHQVRTCSKDYTSPSGVTAPCGQKYRNCLLF